jgi:hypothetical protein
MFNSSKLYQLRHSLQKKYAKYRNGLLTQEEYIAEIKPIDKEIDRLEMSTLQDIPALKGSSSLLSHRQES